MRLAFNVFKMAKGVFSSAVNNVLSYLMMKHPTRVPEEKNWGVVFPGYKHARAVLESHPAMVCEIQTESFLLCQNGTEQNPLTHWRQKDMGAPATEPMPSLPWTPPAPHKPPCDNGRAQYSEIEGLRPGYMYIQPPRLIAWYLNYDAYGRDWKLKKKLIPDSLTDEGISTWY